MLANIDTPAAPERWRLKIVDRWCYFGGSSTEKQQQQSTSTNTTDPALLKMLTDNYSSATTRANSLTPYTGQITAGFNPTQTSAQGMLSNLAADPRYSVSNQGAADTVGGILSANPNTAITPSTVTPAPYSASTYNPSTIAGADLSPYMSPYQKDVIDASQAQNQYQREQQGVLDNATATAAGAFGGTRQAVQRAETTAGYDRNDQQNLATLNSANFNQAQTAAGTDAATRNAASQFNANATNTAGQFNSGQDLNARQFNTTTGVNAQQASINNALAQAGFKVNAAGQLVALNNGILGTAAQQGGILATVGDAQQSQQQTELTNAYNAYMAGQQLTVQQQLLLNSALGLIPNQQTVSSSGTGSSTTSSNPGLGGILSSLGSAAIGGAKLAAL